jgi:peptidoglycan/xylan/chitin deacetylase (PgdA/CDA1 family)
VALTIDDGTSSEVVGAYVDFLESSGVRLTFFVNGVNPSWSDHARRLQPLVEFGQVQLGNHTWSHPDVTKLSDRSLADEINRNGTFIRGLYGVDARPYFRPPYGYHNAHTDRVAAGLGYTTQTLWYGSFGDSGVLTEAELMNLARQWLLPQHIVIGHANHPTVTRLYGQLLDLITERQLRTVTLDDIFTRPHQ